MRSIHQILRLNKKFKQYFKQIKCDPAEKKQKNPAQNTIENVMDLMVIMGIVLVLMETIMVSTGM